MSRKTRRPVPPEPRSDHPPRRVEPREHDTYKRQRKPKGAIVCDACGVVNHAGRWCWGAPPVTDVRAGLCPACERIRDRYPAGRLRLHGSPAAHREEIVGLIRNVEEHEKAEHPLERLMDVVDGEGGMSVTTTGMHLARCIASALERRFHGEVSVHYAPDEHLVSVEWKAD